MKCKNDDHIYIDNPPDEETLLKIYSQQYFEGTANVGYRSNVFKNMGSHLKRSKRRVEKVKKFHQKGTILDVGCGPAYFLSCLPESFDVYGADISQAAADFAMEQFNIKIWVGDFLKLPDYKSFFNAVTMFSQLEHTVNPRKTLEKVNEILKNGGLLLLSLPNINGIPRYVMGKNWRGFSIPEHLHFFNEKNLGRILEETGFIMLKSNFSENNFTRDTNYFYAKKR